MSVEEIKTLVELEKNGVKQVKEEKEKGQGRIAEAKRKASEIISAAEDQEYYESLLREWMKETYVKKKVIEEETEQKMARIREAVSGARTNEAVSLIVKRVLEE